MRAVEVLKDMNKRQVRKVPDDAPTSFVRKRWRSQVHTLDGLDRRFYELCVLSELKNSLLSGDVWVQGSRQFKDFEEYLLLPSRFSAQREQQALGLARVQIGLNKGEAKNALARALVLQPVG